MFKLNLIALSQNNDDNNNYNYNYNYNEYDSRQWRKPNPKNGERTTGVVMHTK